MLHQPSHLSRQVDKNPMGELQELVWKTAFELPSEEERDLGHLSTNSLSAIFTSHSLNALPGSISSLA